ncbi:hypothetical protein DNTS_009430 [Danionella cerebrum]|uniref:Nucleoporin Nup54 alpha-helical domain-containing protein n=1 Tax=Danionella cerebrum TaxID=2873325 RepID=A0A553NIH7_9TELE|nr:hypothetical protein DNTS_009430 [Danionella translucida]
MAHPRLLIQIILIYTVWFRLRHNHHHRRRQQHHGLRFNRDRLWSPNYNSSVHRVEGSVGLGPPPPTPASVSPPQQTQNKGFGFTAAAPGAGFNALGFGGFSGLQNSQVQPGATANATSSQLLNTASALSAPAVLNDERDSLLARWNQLQAFWGSGRGYYNNSQAPVEFSPDNPFCRFKAVGFSCAPDLKDEEGCVALILSRPEAEVRSQQQQLVESLHRTFGGALTISVNVEGVRALPDDQTEVLIYLVERSPSGSSKRIPASTLQSFLEQMSVKSQLTALGVLMSVSRTALSHAQIKQLLQNPPAGVDPIIWEQAKEDNPDPEKLIPVPMVGFRELLRRLKIQEQMNKQHQTRVDIISNDVSELQRNQATTAAKITQYKRKLMELSHRVLQVLIRQEVQRKSGFAVQLDEEHLRVQLETIQSELNAPTQFKGRLNELMSQIRMQNHFGAVRAEERYRVDADLLREIKQASTTAPVPSGSLLSLEANERLVFQHLKQQQDGLSHLISVIKDDLDDLKIIEDGLQDSHSQTRKIS